jgi:16S rRNA (guanine527-N7)-methyltransferase
VEDQPTDWAGIALAKALAPPPVAAEWCLPLVRPGGTVVLWIGKSADTAAIAHVARLLAAEPIECPPGFAMLRKLGPTPPGFPRRMGVARKRPLA